MKERSKSLAGEQARVPLRAAAAVMLWRKTPGAAHALQIYLVQRGERVLYMPSYWAFPGGKTDPQDAASATDLAAGEAAYLACWQRLAATEQAERLATQEAARACARRELFEELGVWSFAATPPEASELRRRRRALLAGAAAQGGADTWQRGAVTQARELVQLAAFATPHFGNLRFAAHYFALEATADDAPEVWPGELSQGAWVTPEGALDLHAKGVWVLAPPVATTLAALADHPGRPEERLEAARAQLLHGAAGPSFATAMVPRVAVAPVRSPTLPPSTHTNCYVLGQRALAVVDPGTPYPDEQAALVQYLDGAATRGGKVTQVWLTHHHADHVGAAMLLKARYGAKVMAHAATAARLRGSVDVDALVVDDQALRVDDDVYVALHTPGHAGGHLCFYDRNRGHLLSGDNVLGMGTSIVMPRPEGDMRAYVQGLERLLTLRLGLLFPGHGPPAASCDRRIAETLKQRYAREQMLLEMVPDSTRPVAVADLVTKLYRGLATGKGSLAAFSCLAHVEKLLDDRLLRLYDGAGYEARLVRTSRVH